MRVKTFILSIAAAAVLLCAAGARAVTPKEMEQARTVTAIVYLRNVNNTSDYLDNVSATSLSALRPSLKKTELENLRKFEAIGMPRDYASWSKEEMTAHWLKVLANPQLAIPSAGYARKMAETRLNKIQVSSPATETPGEQAQQQEQPQTEPAKADTVRPAAETNLPQPFAPATSQAEADSLAGFAPDSTALADAHPADAGSSSHTVYIIILIILVILVIGLVIFAVRRVGDSRDSRPSADADGADPDALRDSQRVIDSLRAENAELRRAIDEYKYHLSYLREERDSAERRRIEESARRPDTASRVTRQTPAPRPEPARRPDTAPSSRTRVIYLGRANADGVFLRAERDLNPDHSLYRLSTADGITGTYAVADNPDVDRRILMNPGVQLAAACILSNPGDTYGKESVATHESGTAIFENDRWRVLRPARVSLV